MATRDADGLDRRVPALAPSVAQGCLRCPLERLAGRNYCGACGNLLRQPCEGEQVTVLFADVSGYTSLSERLDPEQVSEIIDRLFGIVLDVVHEHGGTVNLLGDGVMALFGERPAGEHHARRALRAALAVKERFETVRGEVRRCLGLEFQVRMTVNTGPGVVSTVGDALRTDYTATGNTTGVASRLLGVAEPGQIVLTSRTRGFAAGQYDFEELGVLRLTPSSETVEISALTRRTTEHVEGEQVAAV